MFTDETLRFLRALKRHNDRDWFKARRDQYDLVVKQPMVAIVERLAVDLRSFAPELVASPRISLYRVYRDTRFTGDKSPLKTHVGAVIPRRGLPRHESAGFYFEVAPEHTLVAGGVYAPQPAQLRAIRVHIAANEARWRKLVEHRAFRQTYGGLQGDKLTRVPAGFCRDDPAAEYLKLRQVHRLAGIPSRVRDQSAVLPRTARALQAAGSLRALPQRTTGGSFAWTEGAGGRSRSFLKVRAERGRVRSQRGASPRNLAHSFHMASRCRSSWWSSSSMHSVTLGRARAKDSTMAGLTTVSFRP